MPELAARWPCPVCLGVTMEKVAVGGAGELVLDHCPRCGGIYFDLGEVQLLRKRAAETLWERVPRRADVIPAQCHACHAHIERNAERCPACRRKTRFDCPACQRPMQQARYGELSLDICKRCKGVWFDHHELSAIWEIELNRALERRGKRSRFSRNAGDGSLVLAEALVYSPDLLFLGAHSAGHVAAASAEALAHAPGALASAGQVAGEAAASVFESLLEIVAGIFS